MERYSSRCATRNQRPSLCSGQIRFFSLTFAPTAGTPAGAAAPAAASASPIRRGPFRLSPQLSPPSEWHSRAPPEGWGPRHEIWGPGMAVFQVRGCPQTRARGAPPSRLGGGRRNWCSLSLLLLLLLLAGARANGVSCGMIVQLFILVAIGQQQLTGATDCGQKVTSVCRTGGPERDACGDSKPSGGWSLFAAQKLSPEEITARLVGLLESPCREMDERHISVGPRLS